MAGVLVNSLPRYEILSEEELAVLDAGWRRLVSEIGIAFSSDEAVAVSRRPASASTTGAS